MKKLKHIHLFRKVFDGQILMDEKESMERMFGKMPPLPKGKIWGAIKQWETRYKCGCGETQTFTDLPDGEYNKTLPEEFT